MNYGIGVVYQELKLCPNLSITENIFLGREIRSSRNKPDWALMKSESEKVLKALGMELNPSLKVKSLSIAEQQIIEIAKVLSRDVRILVLDEPTSALTISESTKLFENIRKLRAAGVAVIYISHRLEEVLELSDKVSVLRDGQYKGTFKRDEVDSQKLVKLIAGEKLTEALSRRTSEDDRNIYDAKPIMKVNNLSSADGKVNDASFELYKGEVLGFYGVQGAGRTELLETIFGLRKKGSGEIILDESVIENASPSDAIDNGFAMVTEDRKQSGLFQNMSILENINISNAPSVSTAAGLIRKNRMKEIAEKYRNDIGIKVSDVNQNIMQLSGGNQQKVIIGRWLASGQRIFLVDELTRGVDVGAKAEIFHILKKLREDGLGIVLVSSEIQEVIAESDRVLVMRNGQIVKELKGEEVTKDNIVENALIG